MRKKIVCSDCGREEFNHGLGKCHRCYMKIQMRDRRKRKPEVFAALDKKRWPKRREDQNKKRLERFYANHENNLAKNRAYVDANRDKIHAQQKKYYQRNIEAIRAKNREYNKRRDQVKEFARLKKWVEKQPIERLREIWRGQSQKRMARKNNLPATLTNEEWKEIKNSFDDRCAYCGEKKTLVQEHVIPLCRGGGYTKDNIVPSCASCNSKKGKRTAEEYLEYLKSKSS